MSFEWPKMYKWEENVERTINDDVEQYVLEYYGVEEVTDLTKDQISELHAYCEGFEWQFLFSIGFQNVINMWESEQ